MVDKVLVDYIVKHRGSFSIEALKSKVLASGKSEQEFEEGLLEANKLTTSTHSKNSFLIPSFAGFALSLILLVYFFIPSINPLINLLVILFASLILFFVFLLGFYFLGRNSNIPFLRKASYVAISSFILLVALGFLISLFGGILIPSFAGEEVSKKFLEGIVSSSGRDLFDLSRLSSANAYSGILSEGSIRLHSSLLLWLTVFIPFLTLLTFLFSFLLVGFSLWKLNRNSLWTKISSGLHIALFGGGIFLIMYSFYKLLLVIFNPKTLTSLLVFLDSLSEFFGTWGFLLKGLFVLFIALESFSILKLLRE